MILDLSRHMRAIHPTRPLVVAVALLVAAGCSRPPHDARASHAGDVTALADRYIDAYFEAFPEAATFSGVADAPHDRLSDISPEAIASWRATEDAVSDALGRIDATSIPEGSPEAVTYGFLHEVLRNARDFRTCEMELWNVSPTYTGWPALMGGLADLQPVDTPARQDAALRRFGELPRYLNQEIANLRRGLSDGYSAPRGNVEVMIRQVDALATQPLAESPFVAMGAKGGGDFRTRVETLEQDRLRPAIAAYRDFLRDEYLAAARGEIAVAANPNGADCYRAAVRYHSTVAIEPAEVHRIGLEQMALIRGEMGTIARASFGTDDVAALLGALRTDPRYVLGGRDEMMQVARDAVRRAREALPRAFGTVPRADVVVEAVPAFAEEGAPFAYYNPPAEDGSRPGIYYINLRGAKGAPRAGVESTAFHEADPGHHTQMSIAQERTDLHPIGRYIYLSGFGEGWALYAERLADELGLFSSDVDRMGLLSNEALRAARLVVDSGMHALGWSRDEAIDYMLANTAESRTNVTAEVDRYIAVPGQATAYMLGNLEIRRLRELSRERLGDRFDIRAFHDRVLEDGAVPLMMLRQKLERWSAGPR
jgi:uncharacterized protein (DUF885 family)